MGKFKVGDKVIDGNWLEEVYEIQEINTSLMTAMVKDQKGDIRYTALNNLTLVDNIPEKCKLGPTCVEYCSEDNIYIASLREGEFSGIKAHGATYTESIAKLEVLIEFIMAAEGSEQTVSYEEPSKLDEEPQKFDNNKPRTDLIRPEFTLALGEVLAYGADKYSEPIGETPNYLKGDGFNYSRILGSLERHIQEFKMGVNVDPESSKHHLAHAAANLMFLLTYELTDCGVDDRVVLTKDGDEAKKATS